MVEELTKPKLLGDIFDRHKVHGQCFLYIIALVAKSLIKQFDAQGEKVRDKADNDRKQLEKLVRKLQEYEEAKQDMSVVMGATKGKRKGTSMSIKFAVDNHKKVEEDNDPKDEIDGLEELSELISFIMIVVEKL
ncbi:hypothetical protein L226DRAFT_527221 [Lentinus tigrinus ALCF2SS1-7]|uniref:Uncharacterized protein n=1 Tax=Lentinus tigrinus ALCF2SS1-6 TaxID=1328759 RepID=A0A5C2RNX6_9APHY|nr:hypothetical protein L227DRAFT_568026 [Lentinus tigrinus ALCF2SS1-6]RPD68492.1 hypothetical protein L226DRAFT_527221 [Lentinus tigrinus ALCF2SS1-7]